MPYDVPKSASTGEGGKFVFGQRPDVLKVKLIFHVFKVLVIQSVRLRLAVAGLIAGFVVPVVDPHQEVSDDSGAYGIGYPAPPSGNLAHVFCRQCLNGVLIFDLHS